MRQLKRQRHQPFAPPRDPFAHRSPFASHPFGRRPIARNPLAAGDRIDMEINMHQRSNGRAPNEFDYLRVGRDGRPHFQYNRNGNPGHGVRYDPGPGEPFRGMRDNARHLEGFCNHFSDDLGQLRNDYGRHKPEGRHRYG